MDPKLKEQRIKDCLNQSDVNLWELRELALTRGGLINANLRREAWCHLVGQPQKNNTGIHASQQRAVVPSPKELDLIRQDVRRSVLFHYDKKTGSDDTKDASLSSGESSSQTSSGDPHEEPLALVLETVLSRSPNHGNRLQYYQGLHDVAGVVLYNLEYNAEATSNILHVICCSHLRDALGKDLKTLTWFLQEVFLGPILRRVDEELYEFLMVETCMELSSTVLSWLITWFTHDVSKEQVASRLVDAFLASHALLPMYTCIAVLIHPLNRKAILDCRNLDDDTMAHLTIRGLPSKICSHLKKSTAASVTDQDLLNDALSLMKLIPPASIPLLAMSYNSDVDLDRAQAMSVLQTPPSWAIASWSGGSNTTHDSPPVVNEMKYYPHALVACGVSDMLTTTTRPSHEILSQRLIPSRGLKSSSPCIRKLCAQVLCQSLTEQSSLLVCGKKYPNNCLVFAMVRKHRVNAVVYCWDQNCILVSSIRQFKSKRVRVKTLCHLQSFLLDFMFGIIAFSTAFLGVLFQMTLHMLAFTIALVVCQYLDTVIWKLNHSNP